MRIPLAIAVCALLALPLVPAASASEPECIQVYPWSELCQGDAAGFVNGLVCGSPEPCVAVTGPASKPGVPDAYCIAADPWWQLCQGNVRGFLNHYGIDPAPLLP